MIIGNIDILDQTLIEARGVIAVTVRMDITLDEAADTAISHTDCFEVSAARRGPAQLTRLIRRRARNRAQAYFDGSMGQANIFDAEPETPCTDTSENWFESDAALPTVKD